MKTAIQACPWFASASIRLTKLKLSASMYARQLWADASIKRGERYTRERKDRAFFSLLVTRGRPARATRSDAQTTIIIQVHLRTRGGRGFGSRRAMRMAQNELCGCAEVQKCRSADVRMAHEERCGMAHEEHAELAHSRAGRYESSRGAGRASRSFLLGSWGTSTRSESR